MLIRISLIAAIVFGLAVGVLNFVQVRDKITTTIKARDQFNADWVKEKGEHAKYAKLAKDTQTALDRTNAVLVATSKERDDAVAKADEQSKRADGLATELDTTKKDRDAAQNELAAWKALGIPLTNIVATLASLKDVTEERDAIAEEKKILMAENDRLKTKIDLILNPDHVVALPPGLKGKVLVTDPRYDFVVLDIGTKDNRGGIQVQEGGRLLVNHNGKLVAKVQIKSVDRERCIANVMPGWKFSDIMEGDQVLY